MRNRITVEVTQNAEDLAAVFRLRYDIYCRELHSLDARDYANGMERDKYDEHSIHIVAKAEREVVGAIRLIKDNPHGFLMEQQFTLPPFVDRSKTVEHSRAIIRKDRRGEGTLRMLLEKAYEWQREHGYTTCIGAAVMDTLGPTLLKLGYKSLSDEIVTYHNLPVLPVIYYLEP